MNTSLFSTVLKISKFSEKETLIRLLTSMLVSGSAEAHYCGMDNRESWNTAPSDWGRSLAGFRMGIPMQKRRQLALLFGKECEQSHAAGLQNCPGPIEEAEARRLIEEILNA